MKRVCSKKERGRACGYHSGRKIEERRNAKVCGVFFPRRRNENDGDGYRQNNAAYVEIRGRTRKEEREHHTKITRVLRAVFRDRINDFYEKGIITAFYSLDM